MGFSQAPVAHACNPSYSGHRDQENHGSKAVWANGCLTSKVFNTKKVCQSGSSGTVPT
jgi:hypothetical protein